ncbi:chromosome partitioning protein ParA, partial [Alkalihalophilus pseudofirmus]|nr:chromosome partitioning protein ParA [Alkalihalophilus pseudofirmus]
DAIEEVKIKEEKNHVSVKVQVARTGSAEQLQLQTQIVNALKGAGAATVGIRFGQLREEVLAAHRNNEPQKEKSLLHSEKTT